MSSLSYCLQSDGYWDIAVFDINILIFRKDVRRIEDSVEFLVQTGYNLRRRNDGLLCERAKYYAFKLPIRPKL